MRDVAPQSGLDSELPGKAFYPRLVRRVRAYLIDQLVMLAVFALWLFLLPWMDGFTPTQKIFALVAAMLLAEPCLVSLTGGTIGHHLMCLRIRDARSDRNLGLVRAAVRAVLRLMLGWLSVLFILLTRRRQALHDVLTGSLVVIAAPERLPAYDLLPMLAIDARHVPGAPSKWRRLVAVLLYLLAVSIAVSAASLLLISPQCSTDDLCTRQEEIIQAVCGWAWLAAAVAIVFLGIRGKLWGARPRRPRTRVPNQEDSPA
jgi:uncharacterized RDD family membrane protein YckC